MSEQPTIPHWISSIILKPIEFGSNAGVLSFHVSFTGVTPTEQHVAIADLLYQLLHSGFNIKLVSLEGKFPDSSLMLTLVMALKKEGFFIHAVIDGTTYYYWLGTDPGKQGKLVNWLTVKLTSVVWSGFNCDEILYYITSVNDPEPVLPNNTSAYYLLPPDGMKMEELVKFLKLSKVRWHLNAKNDRLAQFIVKLQ